MEDNNTKETPQSVEEFRRQMLGGITFEAINAAYECSESQEEFLGVKKED